LKIPKNKLKTHSLASTFWGQAHSEADFEAAVMRRLEDFPLELRSDFKFVGRQRRLRIDLTWHRVALTFFRRRLRSLVTIDLKLSALYHPDIGQMQL
jgi:predicted nuclease of restriction endonuclease-like (RecB) superfamily